MRVSVNRWTFDLPSFVVALVSTVDVTLSFS